MAEREITDMERPHFNNYVSYVATLWENNTRTPEAEHRRRKLHYKAAGEYTNLHPGVPFPVAKEVIANELLEFRKHDELNGFGQGRNFLPAEESNI